MGDGCVWVGVTLMGLCSGVTQGQPRVPLGGRGGPAKLNLELAGLCKGLQEQDGIVVSV